MKNFIKTKLFKIVVAILLATTTVVTTTLIACNNEGSLSPFRLNDDLNYAYLTLYDPESYEAETTQTVQVIEGFMSTLPVPSHFGLDFLGWSTEEGNFVTDENAFLTDNVPDGSTLIAQYQPKDITIQILSASSTVTQNKFVLKYGADMTDFEFPVAQKSFAHFAGYYSEPNGAGRYLINEQGKVIQHYSVLTNINYNIRENNTVYLYPYFTAPHSYLITIVKGISKESPTAVVKMYEGSKIGDIKLPFDGVTDAKFCTDPNHITDSTIPANRLLFENDLDNVYMYEYTETRQLYGNVQNVLNDNAYNPNASGNPIDIDATKAVGEVGKVSLRTKYKEGKFVQTEILFTPYYDFPTLAPGYTLSSDTYSMAGMGVIGYGAYQAEIGSEDFQRTNFLVNLKKGVTTVLCANAKICSACPTVKFNVMFEIHFKYGFLSLGNGWANTLIEYHS